MISRTRTGLLAAIALVLTLAGTIQARLETVRPVTSLEATELYVRSPEVLDRLALSFDAVVADLYWLRAIQHFGRTRRSTAAVKRYELLYPLLDLTTSLDPYFSAVYFFGAIFLAEPQPGGAGRPDLAVRLLEKGLQHQPAEWTFPQQLGFIYYWYVEDYTAAAAWFARAATLPGAPSWLTPLEATTRAEGGDLDTSRRLWQQIIETTESDWMREAAQYRLAQIETGAAIDDVERITADFSLTVGRPPVSWGELIGSGRLRGVPVDATGVPLVLGSTGAVTVSPESRLYPLPARRRSSGT